jgi:hypothetical protein
VCVCCAGGHVPSSQELIRRGLMAADVFMTVSALCNLVLLLSFFGAILQLLHKFSHMLLFIHLPSLSPGSLIRPVSWKSFWEALSKSVPCPSPPFRHTDPSGS